MDCNVTDYIHDKPSVRNDSIMSVFRTDIILVPSSLFSSLKLCEVQKFKSCVKIHTRIFEGITQSFISLSGLPFKIRGAHMFS